MAAKPTITAEKLKALRTLGVSLEKASEMGAIPIPAAQLSALKTLGVTIDQAVNMGIVIVTGADGAAQPADEAKRKREEEEGKTDQEQERRRAAAARFAASKNAPNGSSTTAAASSSATKAAAKPKDPPTVTSAEEVLVEAIGSVVTFTDGSGAVRELAPQASEVAYLTSDDVFWPLLRRLATEVLALEGGAKDLDGFWASSPSSAEAVVQFAETRGYLLPAGLAAPTMDFAWRRAILAEAAADVMATRISTKRGFDASAFAGPPATDNDSKWVERPADNLEGIASAVDKATAATMAEDLIKDIATAAGGGAASTGSMADRLGVAVDPICAKPFDSAASASALQGGWTLMQEMGIRESASDLRKEFGVRRQILLKRLDCTVQVMSNSDRAPERKAADVLSKMWASWRKNAAEAPPISEWSALAVTKGVLERAVSARVSGPGQRVTNKFKKVQIGAVPNRGGKPEGSTQKDKPKAQQATASAAASGSTEAAAAPKAERGPRQKTFTAVPTSATAEGGSSSSSSAAPAAAPAAAAVTALPAEGEELSIGAKKFEEKTVTAVGARSANKELHKDMHKENRLEREGKKTNDYYDQLAKRR